MADQSKIEACCPVCGNLVVISEESPDRPFCSKRCRLLDLGDWLDESRRIPGGAEQSE